MVTTRRNSDDNVPNFEAMITDVVANVFPNLTAALRTQITNDIRNGVGSSGGGAFRHMGATSTIVRSSGSTTFGARPLFRRLGMVTFELFGKWAAFLVRMQLSKQK
ncbi:hypothetical protein Tco_0039852 [Tanacetum coccineum]